MDLEISHGWIRGLDVSNHQQIVDWPKVARAGFRFAWIKATESVDFTDAFYAGNLRGATEVGLLVGPYHFAQPGLNSPEAEADWFLRFVGAGKHLWTLPAALDFEVAHPDGSKAATKWVRTWLERVEPEVPQPPVLYTGNDNPPLDHAELDRWALWLASYTGDTLRTKAIDPDPTKLPKPGTPRPWHVWQFTGSGRAPGVGEAPDVSEDCDLNVATTAWFASITGAEETSTEEPMFILKHAGEEYLLLPSNLILELSGPPPPDTPTWTPERSMWRDLVVVNEKVRKDLGLVERRIPRE